MTLTAPAAHLTHADAAALGPFGPLPQVVWPEPSRPDGTDQFADCSRSTLILPWCSSATELTAYLIAGRNGCDYSPLVTGAIFEGYTGTSRHGTFGISFRSVRPGVSRR